MARPVRAHGARLIKAGTFPAPTVRVGRRHRVPVAPILAVLHLDPGPPDTPTHPARLGEHRDNRPPTHPHPQHVPGTRQKAVRVWTADAIHALGVTMDVLTAGEILGLSRNSAYRLARRDAFPVPVIRAGRRYRVPVAGILAALYLETGPAGASDDRALPAKEQEDDALLSFVTAPAFAMRAALCGSAGD